MNSSSPAEHTPANALQRQLEQLRADQERLFRELQSGESRLRRIARSVSRIEEDERRRIARDLHDGVGQNLSALRHRIEAIRPRLDAADGIKLLDEALEICGQTLADTRHLARLLRPQILDDLGLEAALRWLAASCASAIGCEIEVEASLDEAELDPELSALAFRIVQESLTNVVRHSQASHVTIRVASRGGQLAVVVVDDGIGFDVKASQAAGSQARSAGLAGMQERVGLFGGRLNLISGSGAGTQVRAHIPLSLRADT